MKGFPTRREIIGGLGATSALTLSPCSTSAAETRPRKLVLPPWPYGNDSSATDTVLMFRGNGAHTFYGTGPLPEVAPKVRWRFRTAQIRRSLPEREVIWAGTGWTGTAVKLGDYVFVGSVGGYVYAFHAGTGQLMWQLRGRGMFKSSLCAWRNRLYIGNTDNLLRCIDAERGRVIWTVNTGNDLDSSPCIMDGKLYIAGENGHVRCLDAMTGRQIWKRFVGGIKPGTPLGSNGSETSPAVADGEVYAATYDGMLYSLEAETGRIRWTASTGDDTDASPVIAGDFVYAAAEEEAPYVYCFARSDGRRVWRYDGRARGYYSTPAVVGNRLWIGAEDGRLHCIDALTGEPIWQFRTRAAIWSSPCVIDDKVVFGSRDGRLYCLDATNGRKVWHLRLDGRIISSPCIVDGRIWIGTATGWFYGIW